MMLGSKHVVDKLFQSRHFGKAPLYVLCYMAQCYI